MFASACPGKEVYRKRYTETSMMHVRVQFTDVLVSTSNNGGTCKSRNAGTGTGMGMNWKVSSHKNPVVHLPCSIAS